MVKTFRKKSILATVLWLGAMYSASILNAGSFISDPEPCCATKYCGQGFISGDFLYWRAYEGGLDTCEGIEVDGGATNGELTSYFKGKKNDPHFRWEPAFRVGAGFIFANSGCDGWDVAAYWTRFRSHNHDWHSCAQERHWKLEFDVVDLLLGYTFSVRPCLAVRPFAGLRGAKIDQSLKSLNLTSFLSSKTRSHDKQELYGIGPMMGLEANFNLGCGFSLYADAAAAILYGNYRVKSQKHDTFSGGRSYCNLKQRINAYQGAIDVGFGIAWTQCLCNSMQLILTLGVEHHRYFNYNRIGNYGDLCLDGGTFSASIAY